MNTHMPIVMRQLNYCIILTRRFRDLRFLWRCGTVLRKSENFYGFFSTEAVSETLVWECWSTIFLTRSWSCSLDLLLAWNEKFILEWKWRKIFLVVEGFTFFYWIIGSYINSWSNGATVDIDIKSRYCDIVASKMHRDCGRKSNLRSIWYFKDICRKCRPHGADSQQIWHFVCY